MSQLSEQFDRPIIIDIAKDGSVAYRLRDSSPRNGNPIPIFSVETAEEARLLQTYLCTDRSETEDQRCFIYDEFNGDVSKLGAITEAFAAAYERLCKRAAA